MAHLRGFEPVAGVELSVQDEAAAYAGAHEQAHHVPVALGRAEAILPQDPQVHVVADEEGHAEAAFHGASDIVVPPGQVGGKQDHPGLLVDDAGDAGGDGGDLLHGDTGGFQHLLHYADDHLFHVFRLGALLRGFLFQAVHDIPVPVEDRPQDLCPANVQTDAITLCHSGPPIPVSRPRKERGSPGAAGSRRVPASPAAGSWLFCFPPPAVPDPETPDIC